MKKGPRQSISKNSSERPGYLPKVMALISAVTSAIALACAPSNIAKKTTPTITEKRNGTGEVKKTVIKIKRRFAKFCGPKKEVNNYAKDICVEGTSKKFKENGAECVECEREVEVIE